jgi:hypothetical protein
MDRPWHRVGGGPAPADPPWTCYAMGDGELPQHRMNLRGS